MRLMAPQKRQTSDGASTTTSGALQLTHRSGVNLVLVAGVMDVLIWLRLDEKIAALIDFNDAVKGGPIVLAS